MPKSLLYTGTGDTGTTSLVGGERVAKNSVRLDAYGTLDEFSAHLGLLSSDVAIPEEVRGQLLQVQHTLFTLGAHLATDHHQPAPVPGLADTLVPRLEGWIDALDEQTPKIRAFVLPGGTMPSARAHVARTVCRRAERRILDLAATGAYLDPALLKYINRLSDYLFILARYLNFMAGVDEIVWKP